jgi:glutathione S-transferase
MSNSLRAVRDIARGLWAGATDRRTPPARRWAILLSFLASTLRLAAGTFARRSKLGPRPQKALVLWDFERCPWSRTVRETLSELDLDAEVRPCPKGGNRFRSELEGRGVPQLEDRNSGERVVGSREVIRHLHKRYGHGRPNTLLLFKPVVVATGIGIRLLTGGRGAHARPSRAPAQPLELWSFEASPFCRMVRELLSEMELPYLVHNVAKGSPKRRAFIERTGQGRMQVPWLEDPNTGIRMHESWAIEQYLRATYGDTSGS